MSAANPVYNVRKLLPGDLGVEQTVYDMSRLALRDSSHSKIKNYAKKFRRKSDIETVYAAFDTIYKEYKYVNDPDDTEFFSAPVHFIDRKEPYSDCDDLTGFLCSILIALGFKVIIKTISWDRERCTGSFCPFTHVYLMVLIEDKWMPLDPVKRNQGFGKEHAPIIRVNHWKVN